MKIAVRLRMVALPLAVAMLLTFLTGLPVGASALSGLIANHPSAKHPHLAAASNTAMLMYKNDTYHSGLNPNETALTPNNVNPLEFGKRASYSVDGQVYAQPLYMPNVAINGGTNIVFIATEHNSVYAFNADATGSGNAPLWHKNFGSSVSPSTVSCNDMTPEIGITSTPVIVPGATAGTGTLYFVSYTSENGTPTYRLHALDITTGSELSGSIVIKASGFDTKHERQRANLLYANGQIYMAFASFCDNQPYHGFIISYKYDGTSFSQQHVYNDTPGGAEGGIWGGAGSLTADSGGYIYFMTGNGTFGNNGQQAGDSFVKLSPSLGLTDYFTPFNQSCLQSADADLGSGGPLLLSSTHEMIGAGKEGRIYVIDRNNMGHYNNPFGSSACSNQGSTSADHIVQEFPPHTVGGIYNTPSTWTSSSGTQYVYFAGIGDNIKAYTFNSSTGKLSGSPGSKTPEAMNGKGGGNPVLSSNGGSAGILWVDDPAGVLRAYDATNLGHELYNSQQNSSRDGFKAGFVKFSAPTVANGEVFVGESGAVDIYGELQLPTSPEGYNNIGISNDTNTKVANYDGNGDSYSAQALQSAGITPGASIPYGGYTFHWPNAQPGNLDNWLAIGQTVPVTTVSSPTTLGFLGSATDGAASGTATINFTDGSTKTFTLGLTDWAKGTTSFNNQIVATLSYRNTPGGKQTTKVYIFLAEVSLPAGVTVQNVSLPSNVSGGQMHVFSVAESANLPNPYNNVGISNDSNPTAASFDLSGNSYSAQALAAVHVTPGSTVTFNGVSFTWPNEPVPAADNYSASGQVIDIPAGNNESALAFLGAAINGNASGQVTVTYTDKSTESFALNFSDWTLGGNKKPVAYGNGTVITTAYRNTKTGQQTTKTYVFYTAIPLPGGKTVASVTLPTSSVGGLLHVFAVAVLPAATGTSYNNAGISDDGNPSGANFDFGGYSYSAQALQAAGVTPNCTINFGGYTFTWPNVPSGLPDNYTANGETIPVTPGANATSIGFLGASSKGAISGTVTITYTDGTQQQVTLGFSDWTLNAGTVSPSFGNQIAVTTTYRNSGTGSHTVNTYVFFAQLTLTAGKTVKSITLFTTSGLPTLHVFSIATK